jgi:uncharacterized protein (TIGR00645 family)
VSGMLQKLEQGLEKGLFASRWLMAPFYVGLVLSLVFLLVIFVRQLVYYAPQAFFMTPEAGILAILALIDLSLAANLLLIVIFSGYENFVSRMESASAADRPAWMGTVDFSGLKLKLIASIVAISGIDLLKSFMSLGREEGGDEDPTVLAWKTGIHLTFVVSGVLLALMDWLSAKAKASKG